MKQTNKTNKQNKLKPDMMVMLVGSAKVGSGNGSAPNRRQAITWTNADLVHRRIYAALGEMS